MATFTFKLPLSDMTGPILTAQGDHHCAGFEMRYVECLEAYGIPAGGKRCMDYIDDFKECVFKEKQRARVAAMHEERKRQYKTGELKADELWKKPPNPEVL